MIETFEIYLDDLTDNAKKRYLEFIKKNDIETFEIYLDDLTDNAKKRYLEFINKENDDDVLYLPITLIEIDNGDKINFSPKRKK